jgi:hypothetical protein
LGRWVLTLSHSAPERRLVAVALSGSSG